MIEMTSVLLSSPVSLPRQEMEERIDGREGKN